MFWSVDYLESFRPASAIIAFGVEIYIPYSQKKWQGIKFGGLPYSQIKIEIHWWWLSDPKFHPCIYIYVHIYDGMYVYVQ